MAILPTNLARVSNQLRSGIAANQLSRTQVALTKVQNELTTGKRVNSPSDDPGAAAISQGLRKTLEKREAYAGNLKQAGAQLSDVDTTLGDVTDLLLQAQQISQANVGDDVTQDSRTAAGELIKSIQSQMMSLANKEFQGSYIFAGDRLTDKPFEDYAGGVKFIGSATTLKNDFDESATLPFMVDGAEVWGALSTRMEGTPDAGPTADASTRIDDLGGAGGHGVTLGIIRVSDGTTAANVDLTGADTLGDVADAISAAGLAGATAIVTAAGLSISGAAGDTLSVIDVGGGTAAADLGILQAAAGTAGTPIVGTSVAPKITPLSKLADLKNGSGISTAGLVITNGPKTATIDFSGAVTVEDMLNKVNGADVGVRAEINEDGNGIRLVNPTQGTELRVAENGGTTAADLGLRSFSLTSPIGELNGGKGVRTADGVDFKISDSAGVAFDVDLTNPATTQDVIDAINTAANAAGAGVTAGFATTGNGITLTDTAAGPQTLTLTAQNYSNAAADLGLTQPAAGGVITGKDVNAVAATGIFSNLAALRNAMSAGDQQAMTAATEKLQLDYQRVVNVCGNTGSQVKEIETRQSRLDDQNLATKSLMSDLEDADYDETISRFQLLQTSLQASLATTGKILNLSLMDFLG